MADADRDSDLGEDSPTSPRSDGESSAEQSCESSDEGVGRDVPPNLQRHQSIQPLQPHQPMPSHQPISSLQPVSSHQQISSHKTISPHQTHQPQHNVNLHPPVGHQQINAHQMAHSHQRSSPRPHERDSARPQQPQHNMSPHASARHQQINAHQMPHQHQRNSPRSLDRDPTQVRDEFEALKTSLHPHLSSLASLAQGPPLSTSNGVYAIASGSGTSGAFPYAPSGFLAPAPPPPAQPVGSASSSSSEGSAAGWSFEEQYKQVRQAKKELEDANAKSGGIIKSEQADEKPHIIKKEEPDAELYELSDDPGRKEFLDDLFAFMQRKNTPITRLPIMAKSVLDLYELYNLVIARGGLVEVINKKLWQEVIKGLRLPSSITSAAFTLRTQYKDYLFDYECEKKNFSNREKLQELEDAKYMKYLYDYECEKKNLSTRAELDVAIEGNRREGRRSSAQCEAQAALAMPTMGHNIPVSMAQLPQHMQPLALPLPGAVPGVARIPLLQPHRSQMLTPEMEASLRHTMQFLQQQQREFLTNGAESLAAMNVPPILSPRDIASLGGLDLSAVNFWNLYNRSNTHSLPLDLEPQREALNLSDSPGPSTSTGNKRHNSSDSPLPQSKRHRSSSSPVKRRRSSSRQSSPHTPSPHHSNPAVSPTPPSAMNGFNGAHNDFNAVTCTSLKFITRVDGSTGDPRVDATVEWNGVTFAGILLPSKGNDIGGHRDLPDGGNHLVSS